MVVGFDAGASACRALAFALGSAGRVDGSVICVHVDCPPPLAQCSPVDEAGLLLIGQSGFDLAPAVAEEVAATRRRTGVQIELVVVEGVDPAVGIVAVAEAVGADHVVIGRPRRGLRLRPAIGGALQRSLACPVTVVP